LIGCVDGEATEKDGTMLIQEEEEEGKE